jgi:biopolymer transport protein ExbD
MRIALLTVLVLLVAGCGDGAPADIGDGLELATVGILGDLPPREGAVVVTVFADGALVVGGKACAWDGLIKRLDELTKPPEPKDPKRMVLRATMSAEVLEEDLEEVEEDTEEVEEQEIVAEEPVIKDADIVEEGTELPASGAMGVKALSAAAVRRSLAPGPRASEAVGADGLRNTDVLLRVDRRVPWAVVVKLLWTLSNPELRLVRVFYGARGSDGAGEGAIACFLPVDSCGAKAFVDAEAVAVRLRAKPGEGEGSAAPLADRILTRMASRADLLSVHIAAPDLTPFEVVMTAVDAALRAGAGNIEFDGRMPEKTVAELCKAARESGPFHVEVAGRAMTLRPAEVAASPRRHAGYVGTTNEVALSPELEEPILDEDGNEIEDK